MPRKWKLTARTSFRGRVQTVALQAWIALGMEKVPFDYITSQSSFVLRVICANCFLLVRLLLL